MLGAGSLATLRGSKRRVLRFRCISQSPEEISKIPMPRPHPTPNKPKSPGVGAGVGSFLHSQVILGVAKAANTTLGHERS